MNCWDCGKGIDPQDRYCRFCGQGQGEFVPWYYRPLWIGALTLFAMGPFSLFLVWRTPRLNSQGRCIATALILAFTGYIAYSCMVTVNALKTALQGGALSPLLKM